MAQTPLSYETVTTSNRTAEALAQLHGFENVTGFAESLSPNARVTDVGAGDSMLGIEVAALRPDVVWTNIDFSYFEQLPEGAKTAPANIHFKPSDATKLTEILEPDSQDVVLTYWMETHLSMYDDGPAAESAKAMWAVAKPGGWLSVGPDFSRSGRLARKLPVVGQWPSAFRVVKDGQTDADDFARRVVESTKARGVTRQTMLFSSEVVVPFFGSSRYLQQSGNSHLIRDPASGEFVPVRSKKAARIAGQLAVAGAKHIASKRKAAREN